MSKPKMKGLASLTAIKDRHPPATVGRNTGRGEGVGLTIMIPEETRKALKITAAERETTVRVLVLEALKGAGYPVPEDGIEDRRK